MPRRSNRGTSDTVFLQNAVKTLVANIRFASVDNPVKTLVVTSSIPNEGKSTISIELARALAAGGKDVLIVEGDLRRRTLAGVLGAHPRNGIYSVLSGQAALDEAVVAVGGKSSLWFLDAEPHIPNPVDIFSSRRFHRFVDSLRRSYDYVIFDTPPLSTFVDAAVLGSVADGTLLVVREDFVKREDLISSYDQLRKAEANVIGAVLNYCDTKRGDYYYSYYDQGSAKAGEKDLDAPVISRAVAEPELASVPEPQDSGLRPLPQDARVAPDSTAQFLAGTHYQPRSYEDE